MTQLLYQKPVAYMF